MIDKAIVDLRENITRGKPADRWFDSATRRSSSSYPRYLSRTRPSLRAQNIRECVFHLDST